MYFPDFNLTVNTTNVTNSSQYTMPNSSLSSLFLGFIIMAFFTTCIITTGLLANLVTIMVIRKTRALHTTTNFLLANLALADFLTLIFGIPNGIAVMLPGGHPSGVLGEYLCKFLTAGKMAAATTIVSILTLCLLAIERYHAIVKPMVQNRRLTVNSTKYAICCIWSAAFISSLPEFIYTTYNPRKQFCDIVWQQHLTYIYITIFLLFFVPLVVIVTCYVAIIKELYWVNKVEPSPAAQHEDQKAKKRLVTVLLIVTTLFLICYGAFACLWPLYEIGLVKVLAYNTSVQCLFVQSCLNPIIYIFQSTNYREALVTMLKCRRRTRLNNRNQSSTRVIELESTRHEPAV